MSKTVKHFWTYEQKEYLKEIALGKSRKEIKELVNVKFNLNLNLNQINSAMASNKIKELRGVLQRGEDDARKFLRQLEVQGKRLPKVSDWKIFEQTLWHDKTTPYVDAIELMDFYVEEVERKWQT